MLSQLFGGDLPPPKPHPKKKSTTAARKKKEPKAAVIEHQQPSAPFKHTREKSPEPAPVDTLDHNDIEDTTWSVPLEDDDEFAECRESDVEEDNYDATSMTMSPEPEAGSPPYGSVESSPGFFLERRSRDVSKKRPPGIALSFDDDSWID
jgi:hypothetical protein